MGDECSHHCAIFAPSAFTIYVPKLHFLISLYCIFVRVKIEVIKKNLYSKCQVITCGPSPAVSLLMEYENYITEYLHFVSKTENVQDDVQAALIKIRDHQLSDIPDAKMKEFKKRKLIRTQ